MHSTSPWPWIRYGENGHHMERALEKWILCEEDVLDPLRGGAILHCDPHSFPYRGSVASPLEEVTKGKPIQDAGHRERGAEEQTDSFRVIWHFALLHANAAEPPVAAPCFGPRPIPWIL
jgi:hypothetical protein